jgi:hypothetical protein
MLTGPGGQPADSMSTDRWDGSRLTIVTKQEMDGRMTESTQVWSVAGSTLTIDTTDARSTQKRVYKKQPRAAMPHAVERGFENLVTRSGGISSPGTSRQSASCRRAVPAG